MAEAPQVGSGRTPLGAPSDDELIAACANGRRDAFGELVERYQDRVFNLTYRLTGSEEEAADAAQEAFLKAYRGMKSFRREASFYTWLFRIAVNEVRSRHRFRSVRPAEVSMYADAGHGADDSARDGGRLAEDLRAPVPDPSDEAIRAERKLLVENALARLEPEQRMMIVLRDIEGRDYGEIAELLECPRGTVKSRLHRARTALKDLLAPALKEN